MQRRRLGGWQRIGIVLSVLWIIGMIAYALNKQSQTADFMLDICRKTAGKTFAECWEETREFRESWWWTNVLGLALLQIGIAWLGVYIVVRTVRWIAGGFRTHHKDDPGPTPPP